MPRELEVGPPGCAECSQTGSEPSVWFCMKCNGCLACECKTLWWTPACYCEGAKEKTAVRPVEAQQAFFCQSCPVQEVMWCVTCEGCLPCPKCGIQWWDPACMCVAPGAQECTLIRPPGAKRNEAHRPGDRAEKPARGSKHVCICDSTPCVCGLTVGQPMTVPQLREAGFKPAADWVEGVDRVAELEAVRAQVRAMPVVQLTARRRADGRRSSAPAQPRASVAPIRMLVHDHQVAPRAPSLPLPSTVLSPPSAAVSPGHGGITVGGKLVICMSSATRCVGCRTPIGIGAHMLACGTHVTHDASKCYAEGQLRVASMRSEAEAAKRVPQRADPRAAAGSSSEPAERVLPHKQVVLIGKVNQERVSLALRCLTGACGNTQPRMQCVGCCGRGAHGSCLGVAKAYADLGQLRCSMCRANDMSGGKEVTQSLLRSATRSMVWEMSVGGHSTARGYGEYQRLERLWVESVEMDSVELPRDSAESMIGFLIWLVADAGRARSFVTVWRAAAGVCAKTRELSMTKSPRVLLVYNDVVKGLGELGSPCTQATRRLLKLMLGIDMGVATLKNACLKTRGGELILARSKVLVILETLCGMRVGEAVGDTHGLLANDTAIVTPLGEAGKDMGVTLECRLHSAKTGPGRYVNCVGLSRTTKIPAEEYLRALFAIYKLKTRVKVDGGFKIETPDFVVLRVSMLGMKKERLQQLRSALKREEGSPTCPSVAAHARQSLAYLKRKSAAADIAEARQYVNIAGGEAGGEALLSARKWAEGHGLGKFLIFAAGPLLRATEPGSGLLTLMPFQEGSTYEHHVKALREAYEFSKGLEEPDLELELADEEPQFANHSLRRFADRIARESMITSGATDMDIDILFGWNEAQRKKDMQLHYAGLDRAQRVQRARVTMFM